MADLHMRDLLRRGSLCASSDPVPSATGPCDRVSLVESWTSRSDVFSTLDRIMQEAWLLPVTLRNVEDSIILRSNHEILGSLREPTEHRVRIRFTVHDVHWHGIEQALATEVDQLLHRIEFASAVCPLLCKSGYGMAVRLERPEVCRSDQVAAPVSSLITSAPCAVEPLPPS